MRDGEHPTRFETQVDIFQPKNDSNTEALMAGNGMWGIIRHCELCELLSLIVIQVYAMVLIFLPFFFLDEHIPEVHITVTHTKDLDERNYSWCSYGCCQDMMISYRRPGPDCYDRCCTTCLKHSESKNLRQCIILFQIVALPLDGLGAKVKWAITGNGKHEGSSISYSWYYMPPWR